MEGAPQRAMMSLEFPTVHLPGFKLKVHQEADRLQMICSGILDVPDVESVLGPPLMRLHEAILERGIPLVQLDLSRMEYMNSFGIKVLASWLYKVENKRPSYRVEVYCDPASVWQQWSLKVVQILAPSIQLLSAEKRV